MDSEGQAAMADKLRRGGYPGEEELAYYTRFLGGDVLVTPMSEGESFPVIRGYGPVQCEVGFVWCRDGSGHASGHYILLRGWATLIARKCGWQRPNVLRRRLRGKQPAPPGYPAAPGVLKKPAASRKLAGRRGPSHFCVGGNLGPCQFNTQLMAQPSRGTTGRRKCMFCQKDEMGVAIDA